jgi:hypothetical protein
MNPGASPLCGLEVRDPFLGMSAQGANIVKLRIEAWPDKTAFLDGKGRLIDDSACDQSRHLRQFRDFVSQRPQNRRGDGTQLATDGAYVKERLLNSDQVPRERAARRHLSAQSFKIVNLTKIDIQILAHLEMIDQLLDAFLTFSYRLRVKQRVEKAMAQSSGAHGCQGPIDNGQQRPFTVALIVADQFEIDSGGLVQDQVMGCDVRFQIAQNFQRFGRVTFKIGNDRRGCADPLLPIRSSRNIRSYSSGRCHL